MTAHDGGCTFPHCPAPPGWCEIDHIIDWASTHRTNIDEGVPACHPHNVLAKQQGWRSTRINGRAAWIPPKWIDPEQRPRYNHLHDTEPRDPGTTLPE
jgi:5-methylcytosine-specific restriction protein A